MLLIKATLVAFGLALPMALAGSANAHKADDQCYEKPETRQDVLGALKGRQIDNAHKEGLADGQEAATKDRLRSRLVSGDQDRTIARLESENERLKAVLVALGVDPERMLRLTEER
jgi:hypothetical protein